MSKVEITEAQKVSFIPFESTIKIQSLVTDLIDLIREALVEVSGGDFCVSTLACGTDQIKVFTRRPISAGDLKQIKTRLFEQIKQQNLSYRLNYKDFKAFINGTEESKYQYDTTQNRLHQCIVTNLEIQKQTIGYLFLGSFKQSIHFRYARVVNQLTGDVTRTLRYLWSAYAQQNERLSTLISRNIDGILLCNRKKRILYINHAARRLLKIPEDEDLIGQSLARLPYGFLLEFLEEAQKEGITEFNNVVNASDNHSKLLGVHLELLKNSRNHEVGWVFIIRDVTKNWQRDQLKSSLSAVSHEISAPFTSLQGALDLLLDRDLGDLNSEQEHCLQVMKDDVSRLYKIISELLDLSRFEDGIQFLERRKQVRLSLLVDKVIDSFQAFAKTKNVRVENRVPKSLPTFQGDRDKLQQVLANLIENGIKFSLPGGHVIIDAELIKTTLKVWVKDQGVGIPVDEFRNIFEKFHKVDNHPDGEKSGHGLGLSIAKQIIESFGGEIWVESTVGSGSIFYFTIPV